MSNSSFLNKEIKFTTINDILSKDNNALLMAMCREIETPQYKPLTKDQLKDEGFLEVAKTLPSEKQMEIFGKLISDLSSFGILLRFRRYEKNILMK